MGWGQAPQISVSGNSKSFVRAEPFRLSLKPITTCGFTGHEQLDETGLIHMNGRVYDARLGRFIQADPLIQDPTKVQSLNRYSYVWNNPLNATDPSGFACEGTACMDTRPEDNKPIERIIVRGTQPDSAMQRHHEAMQRHIRHMVMEGVSQNSISSTAGNSYPSYGNTPGFMAGYFGDGNPLPGYGNDSGFIEGYSGYFSDGDLSDALSLTPLGQLADAVHSALEGYQETRDIYQETGSLLGAVVAGGSQAVEAYVERKIKVTKKASTPYKRPSGATTKAQREAVQNKPCVDCGATTSRQVADHKTPLVQEHYQTGTIDKTKMRSVDSVQPQCPTCSAQQGAEMSRYSRQQKKGARVMMAPAIQELQKELCKNYEAEFLSSPSDLKVGIATNVRDGILPINGFRHPPEGDTTGWYIYAGEELSDDPDFFKPLHVEHLDDWCPQLKKYLGLAPGWRFLIAGDYEDVWFDESLLEHHIV